jgi:hypothetical protein
MRGEKASLSIWGIKRRNITVIYSSRMPIRNAGVACKQRTKAEAVKYTTTVHVTVWCIKIEV